RRMVARLLLASAAGAGGPTPAGRGVDLLARSAPAVPWTGRVLIPPFSVPAVEPRALLFAVGVTLVTSVLCGLAPAIDTSRAQLTTALKEDERSGGGRRRIFRLGVVTEVALSGLLLSSPRLLMAISVPLHPLP